MLVMRIGGVEITISDITRPLVDAWITIPVTISVHRWKCMFTRSSGNGTYAKLMWPLANSGLALHHHVVDSVRPRITISAFASELEPSPLHVPLLIFRVLRGLRLSTEMGDHGSARGEGDRLGSHVFVAFLAGVEQSKVIVLGASPKPRWLRGRGVGRSAIIVPDTALPEPVALGLKRTDGCRHHVAFAAVEDRHEAVDGQVRWGTGKHRDDHAH